MRSARTLRLASTTLMASALKPALVVDPFCLRQFDKTSGKAPFLDVAVADFERRVNELYEAAGAEACLVDGYAPFCKHVFVENFVHAKGAVAAITPENEAPAEERKLGARRTRSSRYYRGGSRRSQ